MGLRSFLVLHRRMGLISAFFVLLLSLTGLLLHHSNSLGLDTAFVGSSVIARWYGVETAELTVAYRTESGTVAQIEQTLYLDGVRLEGDHSSLVGAVEADIGVVIATRDSLLLMTEEAELIETLGAQHGLPAQLTAISHGEDSIWLRASAGSFLADLDALRFTPVEPFVVLEWESSFVPEAAETDQLLSDYNANLISWERLLLDLHSGQLLGSFGRLVVDIMAVLFLFMAATGIWIWSRRRP